MPKASRESASIVSTRKANLHSGALNLKLLDSISKLPHLRSIFVNYTRAAEFIPTYLRSPHEARVQRRKKRAHFRNFPKERESRSCAGVVRKTPRRKKGNFCRRSRVSSMMWLASSCWLESEARFPLA